MRITKGIVGFLGLLCHLPATLSEQVTLLAENGILDNVKIKTKHSGFDGIGFGDYSDRGGGSIEWDYRAESTGAVEIAIRYASKTDRPLDLYIDGSKVATFSCFGMRDWTTWNIETEIVRLDQGRHVLRLEAPNFGPNVNWLSVFSENSNANEPPPTPGPSTSVPRTVETVVYEDNWAISKDVRLESFHSGFDGVSYADYQKIGAYLLWEVDAPATTNYEIKVKYASFNGRNCNIYIDGQKRGTFLFEGTRNWKSWTTETIILNLSAGMHLLKIAADVSSGPNIDWVALTPCGSSCDGAPVPTPRPTIGAPAPTPRPTVGAPAPTPRPTRPPTKAPTSGGANPAVFDSRVVIRSNSRIEKGDFVFSPNGEFKVGLTNQGDLVLQRRNGSTIWSAGTAGSGHRCFVQSDGNVIVRRSNNKAVWTSETYDHPGSVLVVDDGGQIAVMEGNVPIWLEGVPRGTYSGPASRSLSFPIRGFFYYPWYPETWTVNGALVKFQPELGLYSNSDPEIAKAHIDALEYAWADLIICSWWGPETNQDRGRITMLMEEIKASGSGMKISFYHEDERFERPSPQELRRDLDYIKKWFAWHPAWGHIDGRPVIMAFNADGCDVAERWMEASNNEWYVVLKLFPGFEDCKTQPDHWHQYGTGGGNPLEYDGISSTLAPGFWRADRSSPSLPRLSKSKWCSNVLQMVQSNNPFQLIVSFNEHGEATGVESTPNWASNTGYGDYLDCLHQYY